MKIFILFISCIFVINSIYAQNDATFIVSKEFAKIDTLRLNNILNRNMSPNGNGTMPNFISNFSLVSSFSEGENGKIELKYVTPQKLIMGLQVDQKISKSDKTAVPFELDGLSPGTTISLNIGKLFWENIELPSKYFDLFMNEKEMYCRENEINGDSCKNIMLSELGPKFQNRIASKLRKPIIINIKGSLTKSEYNYTNDSIFLIENSNSYLTPSISFSFIRPIGSLSIYGYLAFSYNYSEYYTSGENLSFLIPFGKTPNYFNKSVTFGKPTKEVDNKINIEYRRNFPYKIDSESKTFAVSLSTTYGFNSETFAISIPVYFINGADDKGKILGLQGGVKFSYITNTKELKSFKDGFNVQLLVALPFDVFGALK
ncbi:MAG TPA: hypothetical protein PLU49_09095 [Saprospiraceae bacterium]|nr:hypothetical protein [Saprospirales bacterium]HRQ30213.1 hypothetical protein [Saprospiraceae bacterium]